MPYEELKQRQSVMWGNGPYQRVTETLVDSSSYGPTKTLADSLGDRREDFHQAWVDFFETNYRSNGEIVHTREYLLIEGTRR